MSIQIWYDGLELSADPYLCEVQGKDDVAPAEVLLVPISGGPPVHGATRPKELVLNLNVGIKRSYGSTDFYTYRHALMTKFDTRNATARKLKITSQGVTRYLMGRPRSVIRGNGPSFAIQLVVEDGQWLSETEHSDTEPVAVSGQTWAVSNTGNVAARPTIEITPTSYRAGGFSYRRWIPIRNRTDRALTNYPLQILSQSGAGIDTTGWVSGSKMQADGDDLRAYVDGEEADRWFGAATGSPGGPNSSTTKVWVNFNFSPRQYFTLAETIAATGGISTITVAQSIVDMPATGILLIGSEAFTYTGKASAKKQFTGVSRAARGTSMALHSSGATAHWIEHDVWIFYGDASLGAPDTDDTKKPLFELDDSANTSWVFEEFATRDKTGSAEWGFIGIGGVSRPLVTYGGYASNRLGTYVNDQVADMGMFYGTGGDRRWWIYVPIEITTVSASGEKIAYTAPSYWGESLKMQISLDGIEWYDEWSEGDPAAADTWESFNHASHALTFESNYLRFYKDASGETDAFACEVEGVTLTLDNTENPALTLNSEEQIYWMEATITNETTSEAFDLELVCKLNETIVVDCDARVVENETDQTNAYPGFSAQQDDEWLTLDPGSNTLKYEESGVAAVTVVTKWRDTWN
jgi:hypothetical protein